MIWWAVTGVLSYLFVPLLLPLYKNQVQENYLKEVIPTGLGISFVLISTLLMTAFLQREEHAASFALLLLFFCIFGIIDDFCAEGTYKGFVGHFGARKLSTGGLKAWGGIISSLVLVLPLATSFLHIIVNSALIALTANFLNLLDLRPGRAGKVFLIFGTILFFLNFNELRPLLGLIWAVAGYLFWDLRRIVMMGDTGANPLGAALGYASVITLPFYVRVVLLIILAALNLFSEKISYSKVIDSNRLLRYLDQLGR